MEILIELAWEVLKGLLVYFTARALEDCLADIFRWLEDLTTPKLAPSI